MQLAGRRVLVLGASGDIGTALTHALIAAGAQVLAQGRDEIRLDVLATRHGARLEPVACDLTTAEGRTRLVDRAARAPLDAVVNAVGANRFGLFDALPAQDVTTIVETSLLAPMLCIHALLPMLQASATAARRGEATHALVVNVGSVFGHIGYAGNAAYSAAKFGLRGFSEALARELADSPVRVLHVAPRATRTKFNDARVCALNAELGQQEDTPERVAAAIVEAMQRETPRSVIGFPERFFAWLNAAAPALVDGALRKSLGTIRRLAAAPTGSSTTTAALAPGGVTAANTFPPHAPVDGAGMTIDMPLGATRTRAQGDTP